MQTRRITSRLAIVAIALTGTSIMTAAPLHVAADGKRLIMQHIALPGEARMIAVDAPLKRVVVAATQGGVIILGAQHGKVLATVPTGLGTTSVAVDEGTGHAVAIDMASGSVTTLDVRTGAIIKTLSIGAVPFAVAVNRLSSQAYVATQSGVAIINTRDGTSEGNLPVSYCTGIAVAQSVYRLYALDVNGRVTIFNAILGTAVATISGKVHAIAMGVDERTKRLFFASGNYLGIIDAATGKILKIIRLAPATTYVTPRVVVVDHATGHVFIAADDNIGGGLSSSVIVVDAASGQVLHTVPIGYLPPIETAPFMALDAQHSHLYLLNGGSQGLQHMVSVLDARTGRVLFSEPLYATDLSGANPSDDHAVAVDSALGRAYVASDDGVRVLDTTVAG